jgi:hypothetical protein
VLGRGDQKESEQDDKHIHREVNCPRWNSDNARIFFLMASASQRSHGNDRSEIEGPLNGIAVY